MKPCFTTPFIEKAAKAMGARLLLEPDYRYTGQIIFKNGTRRYFKGATFDINPAGAVKVVDDKDYSAIEGKVFFTPGWQDKIRSTQGVEAACNYAQKLGFPVIVKPNDLSQGAAVSKVHNLREFKAAIKAIPVRSRAFLVQRVAEGNDYRMVVFDGQLICAYERRPLCVRGDGTSSIASLLVKKQRAFDKLGYITTIDAADPRITEKLRRQKLTLQSVPSRGETIYLLDNANLSTGGNAHDVTDIIHPSYRKLAISITRDMGLRLCGVDIMTAGDIARPCKTYHVVELNASPGLDHFSMLGKKQRDITAGLYRDILRALEKQA